MGDLFGGLFGGKGGSSTPAMPAVTPAPDYSSQMAEMSAAMNATIAGMTSHMASSMHAAQRSQEALMASMMATTPPIPDVYSTPAIDWSEAQDKLKSKMSAEFHVDELRRKGLADTVLTSPLLDEEEEQVTSSILTGD